MITWITNVAINHTVLVYLAIFITTIFEGPIISVFSGIILKLGFVKLIPIVATVIIGDLIGDIIWYVLGHHFGIRFVHKYGKYFNLDEGHIKKVSKIFNLHKYKILLGSKLTSGLGFAPTILFLAGLSKVPFKKYFMTNLVGQVIWSSVLLSTGFFFSHLYGTLNNTFQKISLVSFTVIALILLVRYMTNKRDQLNDYLK
ncbi:VTT domain-containing protein [Arenimonas sp.]|nr:VTT domain-containing protein [Candidatus Parcubacteria bacterium]